MFKLLYTDLGRTAYPAALALQERIVELKQREPSADVLLFVEHPHVYTLGRGGKSSNLLAPQEVPVVRTSRGGDVTYHGPGQLVVYPLIDLRSKLRKDVHRYLRNLEMSGVRTLKDFGLDSVRRPPFSGIWIENRKIAAIGIAVRRGITFHGLALNVNPELSYFSRIIPCGLTWAEVTSMARELGKEQSTERVQARFLHYFTKLFGYEEIQESKEVLDLLRAQTGRREAVRTSTIGTTGTF